MISTRISICKNCGVHVRKSKDFCGDRCEKMFIEAGNKNKNRIKDNQMRLKVMNDVTHV